jgi:hypothetical protein
MRWIYEQGPGGRETRRRLARWLGRGRSSAAVAPPEPGHPVEGMVAGRVPEGWAVSLVRHPGVRAVLAGDDLLFAGSGDPSEPMLGDVVSARVERVEADGTVVLGDAAVWPADAS